MIEFLQDFLSLSGSLTLLSAGEHLGSFGFQAVNFDFLTTNFLFKTLKMLIINIDKPATISSEKKVFSEIKVFPKTCARVTPTNPNQTYSIPPHPRYLITQLNLT